MTGTIANVPRDTNRAFRVPDALWNAAVQRAKDRGESLSEVLRASLERYVETGEQRETLANALLRAKRAEDELADFKAAIRASVRDAR